MVKIFRKWYRSYINLIYPLKCVVCNSSIPLEEINPVRSKLPEAIADTPAHQISNGVKSEFLCSDCLPKIKFVLEPMCEKCGRPSNSSICPECNKKHKLFFDRAFSVAIYEGIGKELIHLFKYSKNDCLDKFLAGFLVELIRKNPALKESDLIIPVPLYWQDELRRGYNQTYLLAYQISRITGIPILANRLIKYRKIPSQTTLSGKERFKNVKGAFKVKNSRILEDKKVLLIDDVFTTGSTVNECAKVLREAKVRQVDIVTFACSCEV